MHQCRRQTGEPSIGCPSPDRAFPSAVCGRAETPQSGRGLEHSTKCLHGAIGYLGVRANGNALKRLLVLSNRLGTKAHRTLHIAVGGNAIECARRADQCAPPVIALWAGTHSFIETTCKHLQAGAGAGYMNLEKSRGSMCCKLAARWLRVGCTLAARTPGPPRTGLLRLVATRWQSAVRVERLLLPRLVPRSVLLRVVGCLGLVSGSAGSAQLRGMDAVRAKRPVSLSGGPLCREREGQNWIQAQFQWANKVG